MILGLDHLQLAMPAGAEDRLRAFYILQLGLAETPKPAALQARGGFWAKAGAMQVHFGIDPDFKPAKKAHPAFTVEDIATLAQRLHDAGYDVDWDRSLPGVKRFFTHDPVGNRVELIGQ